MTSARETQLRDALARVRARLEGAANGAGRDVKDIELLPVTKFFPAGDVAALHRLGCTAFAESRDQEAAAKVEDVSRLIGGTQSAGTWSGASSGTKHARWPGGPTQPIRSTARK